MSYSAPRVGGTWAGPAFSIDSLTNGWVAWQGVPTNAVAWGTAYRAIYVPVRVPQACMVVKLGAIVQSTATGNIDIGLYDAAGTRLVSSGSVAKSATVGVQVVDVTDTPIMAGLYYIGLNNSTATDTFQGMPHPNPLPAARGLRTEALGSVTLPATAAWTVDSTLDFVPIVAALLTTVVS